MFCNVLQFEQCFVTSCNVNKSDANNGYNNIYNIFNCNTRKNCKKCCKCWCKCCKWCCSCLFAHLHENQVSHGDLYAHNTLFDQDANIIFGDFGAATMYHMLNHKQQAKIQQIEQRALNYFIEDLLSVCAEEDKYGSQYALLAGFINS